MSQLNGVIAEIQDIICDNLLRFTIQTNDGSYVCCDYYYEESLPLKSKDKVYVVGEFVSKTINMGNWNIFECKSLTSRYEFDLLNFLISYLPYMKIKKDKENNVINMDEVNEFYRNSTDQIMDYCNMSMNGTTPDHLYKLFNNLYGCIETKNDKDLVDFAKHCFNNPDLRKIKSFLKYWNNNVLIRPLQLMGLTESEIKAIHIPLYEAYKIVKTNPYRLPQISMETCNKIVTSHLRLENAPAGAPVNHEILLYKSQVVLMCGEICRVVYNNVEKRKWTSTPISKIIDGFPLFDICKDDLLKYYFCVEDFEHIYYKPIHLMEKSISNKITYLIKKKKTDVHEIAYPDRIPSENQDKAIKSSLADGISLIHGGPGTGKTTICSEIIRNASLMGYNILCCTLTGVAATRIRETAIENNVFDLCTISTIEMAIVSATMFAEKNFKYILIDEISMVHSSLIQRLFFAYRDIDFQLILVGDLDQLEPIDYGNFMDQMLRTPIPKYELTKNYRSEKTIIEICKDIIDKDRIKNRVDINWYKADTDYRFHIGDIQYLEHLIADYANKFSYNKDISTEENFELFAEYRDSFTIVTPYNKVVDVINPIFQKYFMSHVKEHTTIDGNKYYLGDRVMKLINDYGITVMNGEVGKIIKVTPGYIVCIFRDDKNTMTPYIDVKSFNKMKDFIIKNNIKFSPLKKLPDGTTMDKSDEEIKKEIEDIKAGFPLHFIDRDESKELNDREKHEEEYNKAVQLYFSLLEEYPKAMCSISNEGKYICITSIKLAYAVTVHKSEGAQYENVIFFLNGNPTSFLTCNNIYTGTSRAKKHLDIVTSSLELLNGACLNRRRFVYDKLHHRINGKLPKEIIIEFEKEEIIEEYIDDSCDTDDYDIDDFDWD